MDVVTDERFEVLMFINCNKDFESDYNFCLINI